MIRHNYRCITVSCVLSKLFEYCVLDKFQAVFFSSDLQFGFKAKVGCADALYTLKSVVDYYVRNGSTVTLTALDVSKAFDKVSHFALFSKLMEMNAPRCLINVLICWYSKCYVSVKWNNVTSTCFQSMAGVRQGGVLSPVLFAIYIEDIVKKS